MEQIKPATDLSLDEATSPEVTKANDVRTLNDLEMVLCGGGDGIFCW